MWFWFLINFDLESVNHGFFDTTKKRQLSPKWRNWAWLFPWKWELQILLFSASGSGSALPVIFFTLLWGGVGIVLPFLVPKGPNQGVMKLVLMLTGATCWLFWLCCYMAQMNPLIGPIVNQKTALLIHQNWANVDVES